MQQSTTTSTTTPRKNFRGISNPRRRRTFQELQQDEPENIPIQRENRTEQIMRLANSYGETPLAPNDDPPPPPSVEQIVGGFRHLDNVSKEQLHICNSVQHGQNVIVDACAGSGKSTTVLSTCRFMPQTKFLILTFNRALRLETREKVRHLKIENAEVHTYHSLAVLYYDSNAHTDNQLMNLIKRNTPLTVSQHGTTNYDVIVIDEAQDMTPIYFDFIKKFTADIGHPFQLLVLGDYRQCLYQFKGSDVRFLTQSEFLWKNNPLLKHADDWTYATLRTTYRLTNQMAAFVNNALLGEEKLVAQRDGPPVKYYVTNYMKIDDDVFGFINRIVHTEKTGNYDDFFILAPTIKKSALIKKIENKLVANRVPCHIPLIDDSDMDERVINGKVVFCTFHSSKGRQRKYVVVLNFDNSYFDFCAKNKTRTVCPNTIYVATTRATNELYVFEEIRYKETETPKKTIYSFKFLKLSHQEMATKDYIKFIDNSPPNTPLYLPPPSPLTPPLTDDPNPVRQFRYTSPTELTKFLSYKVIDVIYPLIDQIWRLEYKCPSEINIPTVIQTATGHEDVCDLNGIVIPLIYYDWIYQSNAAILRKQMYDYMKSSSTRKDPFIKQNIIATPPFCDTAQDYLFMANITQTIKEKFHFRLRQINQNGYDWLSPDIVEACMQRLYEFIPAPLTTIPETEQDNPKPRLKIEEVIVNQLETDYFWIDNILDPFFANGAQNQEPTKFRFTAIVDIVSDRTIWELKCTNDITFEHKIQVVIYAWLWQLTYEKEKTNRNEPPKIFRILNIKSGEVWRLAINMEHMTTIVVALLRRYVENGGEDEMRDDDDVGTDDGGEFIRRMNRNDSISG
jgi:hypothetical protein